MNKQEFLAELRNGLNGLPKTDIEERIAFYGEMIDDRMEEGLSEEEAVSQIGSAQETIAQIIAEIPFTRLVKERIIPKKKLGVWEIILLILGSPIWLSLLIAAFAVIFSVYVSLCAIIISLWSIFASLIACGFGGILAGAVFTYFYGLSGVALIGESLFCAGLSVFAFFGCKYATKGIIWLTRKLALGLKNCFIIKGEA